MKYRTDLIFLLDFLYTGYLSSFIFQILHFCIEWFAFFLFLMARQWKQRISELGTDHYKSYEGGGRW